jgi:hypothetical protein
LVDFLDTIDNVSYQDWIAKVTDYELVGRRSGIFVKLEVHGADPVPFGL